jgi:hypothetical protein
MTEQHEPQREMFSIVVLGDFNPAIFHPLWFSNNNLLPAEEAEKAEIAVIAKEIASFVIGGIAIQVEGVRLGFTINEPQNEPVLRDVLIGTLTLLEHTPLRAIGFNRDMIFDVGSKEVRNEIGFRLVPKESWQPFLETEGMRSLTVQGKRPDCKADFIQVQVSPSAESPSGILTAFNQHYRLETDARKDPRQRHAEALRALSEDWRSFISYARNAVEKLLWPTSASGGE